MNNDEKTILFDINAIEADKIEMPKPEPEFDLGLFFKKTRLEKKISFSQIQEKTLVKVVNFEKIEENDYDYFDDNFYLKMYIKEYAKILDIDYNEIAIPVDNLIKQIDDIRTTKLVTTPQAGEKSDKNTTKSNIAEKVRTQSTKAAKNRGSFELPSWIWIVLIVIVLALGYFFMSATINKNNPEVSNTNETTLEEPTTTAPATEEQASEPATTKLTNLSSGSNYEKWDVNTSGEITITLTATKDGAAYEFCDDLYTNCEGATYPVTGTLKNGESTEIKVTNATNFSLYIADTSAFTIKINDQALDYSEQNIHFTITKPAAQ